jgi:L-iditol 2-dehydrogenase
MRGFRLPDHVPLEFGALAEPLSVAIHARDRASPPPNATILVFGAGAVGLLCGAASKAIPGSTVIIADILEDRVKFATANGFADLGVVVPMKRPETVTEKLEFAKLVAETIKSTEVNGQPIGEVAITYECTGVESCVQSSIYV